VSTLSDDEGLTDMNLCPACGDWYESSVKLENERDIARQATNAYRAAIDRALNLIRISHDTGYTIALLSKMFTETVRLHDQAVDLKPDLKPEPKP
jgi:hypothetical protein